MTAIDQTAETADVAELYARLARRLEHIVRLDVRAPDAVIEDACQFAWARLLHHRDRIHHETAMRWLATTAVREAFKLVRRDRREVSLEAECQEGRDPASPAPTPFELVERRERLRAIGALPERQQRVLWLQTLGLSYGEIAQHEACTLRTVERQLLRARHALRATDRD